MIKVTDEMVQLAVDKFLDGPSGTIGEIDGSMRDALAAVLAIVDRDHEAGVIERLSLVYCADCGIRMFHGTPHPHELIPVTVTVARRSS